MGLPMLADFAARLSCGLAILLLLTNWRLVPPAFFRTHCLVILGLVVLAGLDAYRVGVRGPALGLLVAAGVVGYLSAVAWGLGVPRLAVPLTVLVVGLTGGVLVGPLSGAAGGPGVLPSAARLSSAFLMGSTLTAMLLGHHYLTAPAMSIDPLKRFVRCMAWGLFGRALLAAAGLWLYRNAASGAEVSPLFLGVRWGMGLLGPALATWMTWKTVEIRSTQSATGILYIGMTLVLFGELTAMVLTREAGFPF